MERVRPVTGAAGGWPRSGWRPPVFPSDPCIVCDKPFEARNPNRRYCSQECKDRKNIERRTEKGRPKRYGADYYHRVIKVDPARLALHRRRSDKTRAAVRRWLAKYKLDRGCVDCGYKKYACALQLDHNGPKTAPISRMRSSIKRIQDEINRGKCVVRCANCHAVKTWKTSRRK